MSCWRIWNRFTEAKQNRAMSVRKRASMWKESQEGAEEKRSAGGIVGAKSRFWGRRYGLLDFWRLYDTLLSTHVWSMGGLGWVTCANFWGTIRGPCFVMFPLALLDGLCVRWRSWLNG